MDPTVLDMLDQGFTGHHPLMGCDFQDLSQRVEVDTYDVIELANNLLDLTGALRADIIGYIKHEDVHYPHESTINF
jgi:hypothetical protein